MKQKKGPVQPLVLRLTMEHDIKKITIFIADDHRILREGLNLILSSDPRFEIVGESGDGKEAVELIDKLKPDITILDISMPTMTGIEATKYLKKYVSGTKIIILSRHDNEDYVKQLLKYGINGYVLKDDAGDDIIRAIDEVLDGNFYLSPRITSHIVTDYIVSEQNKNKGDKETVFRVLTSREREVVKLIAEGKNNTEIAAILRISSKTVKVHRANIMKKLGIHKLAELVKYAIKTGIVEI